MVIFDEDRDDRYQYLTTWLGRASERIRHGFYSTQPFENIVGPGMGRAEYGGLLMTLPPRRLYDVWATTDYDFAEIKAERLLMAGLDYSMERSWFTWPPSLRGRCFGKSRRSSIARLFTCRSGSFRPRS